MKPILFPSIFLFFLSSLPADNRALGTTTPSQPAATAPISAPTPPMELPAMYGGKKIEGPNPTSPSDLGKIATEAVVKREDGSVGIGLVTVDPVTRTLIIPASVNAVEGQIEYALVHSRGKVHESLLRTEATPVHIHLGSLLLGIAEEGKNKRQPRLSVEVEWETNGPKRREKLGDLILFSSDNAFAHSGDPLRNADWRYFGSEFSPEGFAAQVEGSIITVIGDAVALIGNTAPGHDSSQGWHAGMVSPGASTARNQGNDRILIPNAKLLPPVGMPVRILISRTDSGTPK